MIEPMMMKSQFVLPFILGAVIALALVGGAVFAGPFLTKNQSTFLCPGVAGFPTYFKGTGFLMSRPTGYPNSMQFVIKPNSTAFIQTTYSIPSNSDNITAQSIYANRSEYFTPIQFWYKLGNSPSLGLNTSQVGMTAMPVNVTANGNHSLNSTYELSTSATAQEGAYAANWWSICGPQIVLTIGYSYYTGPGLQGKYL